MPVAKLDETLSMLKDLTDAKGIAGNEVEVRAVVKKIYRALCR